MEVEASQELTMMEVKEKGLSSTLAMALPSLRHFIPDEESEELEDDGDFATVPFMLVSLGPEEWRFKGVLAKTELAHGLDAFAMHLAPAGCGMRVSGVIAPDTSL